ncbi:MAG: ExbD/TolR family protein [Rhodothermales bacterium]
MSFNFSSGKKPLTVFGMAGLADIVLLLLIFFLLTSNFIPQFGIQVNLPQANASSPNEAQNITVAITKEGRFYVDGSRVARESLLDAMTQARTTKTGLVIRADKDATVDDLVMVATNGKALGLRIKIQTERADLRPGQ